MPEPTEQGETPETPQDQTEDPQAQPAAGETPADDAALPEPVRKLIAKLRQEAKDGKTAARERDALKTEKQQRDEAAMSETDRLRVRVQQLESVETQHGETKAERDSYRAIVLEHQESAIKALPEPLRKLVPAVSEEPTQAEINARSRFLADAADAAQALSAQQPGPAAHPAGVPATPKPANGQSVVQAQQNEHRQLFAQTFRQLAR
jgi:hypothetical protein